MYTTSISLTFYAKNKKFIVTKMKSIKINGIFHKKEPLKYIQNLQNS